jgi:hypothetical protein
MLGPLSQVNFDDVPAPQHFQACDGARLQYYAYLARFPVSSPSHGSIV